MHRQFEPRTASWLAICGLALSIQIAARGQSSYPPSTPFLHIETGMHTAQIMRIDVDASERFLVSASLDKTARVWDLPTGRLLRVLRPPEGSGSEGNLDAVAISPDGAVVALGGWTGPGAGSDSVYLFERSTGSLVKELRGFPNVIGHLSYSKDGSYLVAALARANGIRVFRTSDYQQIASDSSYGSDSYWAEFDRSGRLVTTSDDGFVRVYGNDFHLLAKRQLPGGKEPFCARFSPDGTKIALGFSDSTAVNVISGNDLSFLYAPDTKEATNGSLSSIAWSLDGKTLYAAGRYDDAQSRAPIFAWSRSGRGSVTQWPVSGGTVFDLHELKGNRIAVGASDPIIGVWDGHGRPIWEHTPEIFGYIGGRAFGVSDDGNVVKFDGYSLSAQAAWS